MIENWIPIRYARWLEVRCVVCRGFVSNRDKIWYFDSANKHSIVIRKNNNDDVPVMIGGSTTVDGPKNDGISPDVVTGVFKSPVCCCTLRSADCCWLSWILSVGWWCPAVEVVVVAVDEDTAVESDFDWVTEVAECELVMLLFEVFAAVCCWIVDCCICWRWWLLSNWVCEWWLLLAVEWLLLFKL